MKTSQVLQNKWVQRLLFWFASWCLFYRLFSNSASQFAQMDALYAALFLLLLSPVVLLTNGWLIPRFLNRNRLVPFLAFFGLFNTVGTAFNLFFFSSIVDVLFPGLYFINYYSFGELVQFYFAFSGIAALLQLSKGWFQNIRTTQQIDALKKEKLIADLNALKSQINPHFLFNSLNNIYALSLTKSDRAPKAIMQLSELLRYNLYHTHEALVPVKDELEMVGRYIELQKMRFTQPPKVVFEIDVDQQNIEIPPMLLQPLFENAFKHGDPEKSPMIQAELTVHTTALSFAITNAKPQVEAETPDEDGGVGLENMHRRLELLYPEKHQFDIEERDDSFSVTLSIQAS